MKTSTPRVAITLRPGPAEMAPLSRLRKPYKFLLPVETFSTFKAGIKDLVTPEEKAMLQCVVLSCRPLVFGVSVTVWLFGHSKGFTGCLTAGVAKDVWDAMCARITARIVETLSGAMPYKEEWSMEHKFQFSFETAVMCGEGAQ